MPAGPAIWICTYQEGPLAGQWWSEHDVSNGSTIKCEVFTRDDLLRFGFAATKAVYRALRLLVELPP